MDVERLNKEDVDRLRRVRLLALENAPDAFGTTLEEATGWPPANWHQQLRDLPTFVAVQDGHDVGMVRCAIDKLDRATAWLLSMWVASESRRQGVGAGLIDAVLEWAAENGVRRIVMDVGDHNGAAVALYASKGFEPNGEVSRFPVPRDHILEHQRELKLV